MKYFLITAYQLFVYLVMGLSLLPVQYALTYLILGERRAYKYAIIVDILICVVAHGEFRTISGMTGDKKEQRRYKHQLTVINFLLYPFDGEKHCERIHEHEQSINYNYYEFFRG